MTIRVLLLIAALAGCSGARLRKVNHAMLAAASATLACDYGQTMWSARSDWADLRYEANPILGTHPSQGRITAYFAAIGLLAIASTELPEWVRLPLYAGTLAVETYTVIDNSVRWDAPWCGLVGP